MEANRESLGTGILGILTIVFAWRGYRFYQENTGSEFVDDIINGLSATLSAGWDHPAFGLCCLMPALLIVFKVSEFIDRWSGDVELESTEEY